MKIVDNISDLRQSIALLKKNGSVCFVPTMGYLHNGHVSLIKLAKTLYDHVVVSTFVNPKQFSIGEDYTSYPRNKDLDKEKCASASTDIMYIPDVSEIYPIDFSVSVDIGKEAREMCGKTRVNYFNGIMVVIAKLANQVSPSAMIFGEKDYQMFFLIKRFMRHLDFDIDVISAPTVRELDGLACSSRNVYLSVEERKIAHLLYQMLCDVKNQLHHGVNVQESVDCGKRFLSKVGFNIDYVEVRSNQSLELLDRLTESARVFCAAYLGKCRLIDNIFVEVI